MCVAVEETISSRGMMIVGEYKQGEDFMTISFFEYICGRDFEIYFHFLSCEIHGNKYCINIFKKKEHDWYRYTTGRPRTPIYFL